MGQVHCLFAGLHLLYRLKQFLILKLAVYFFSLNLIAFQFQDSAFKLIIHLQIFCPSLRDILFILDNRVSFMCPLYLQFDLFEFVINSCINIRWQLLIRHYNIVELPHF